MVQEAGQKCYLSLWYSIVLMLARVIWGTFVAAKAFSKCTNKDPYQQDKNKSRNVATCNPYLMNPAYSCKLKCDRGSGPWIHVNTVITWRELNLEKRVPWVVFPIFSGYQSQHIPPWKPWSDLSMPKRADSTQSYSSNANSVNPHWMQRLSENVHAIHAFNFNRVLIWKLCPAWKLSRVWIVTAQIYLASQIKTACDIFDHLNLIQQWQSTSLDWLEWKAMTYDAQKRCCKWRPTILQALASSCTTDWGEGSEKQQNMLL